MKSVFVISILSILSLSGIAQKQKKEEFNFLSKELIQTDSIIIERVPLNKITSGERFFIDALQKQLDQVKNEVKSDSLASRGLINNINRLLLSIKSSDPSWKHENYSNELAHYSKFQNSKQLRVETKSASLTENYNKKSETVNYNSTSKTIQTGPRGGRYYINSNGKKTYIKKK